MAEVVRGCIWQSNIAVDGFEAGILQVDVEWLVHGGGDVREV